MIGSMCVFMLCVCVRVRVCVPVKVLSGGDSKGTSATSRPQQQVSSLGLSFKQQLCLQTRHAVETAAGRQIQ